MKANGFIKEFGLDRAIEIVNENKTKLKILSTFEMELKTIVKSHALVNSFGGLVDAKAVSKMGKHYKYLKKAIADVESCQ